MQPAESVAIRTHRGVPAVFAREQAATRRRTHRRPGEEAVENNPHSRHPVEVRRLRGLPAHEGQLKVTQLVIHDLCGKVKRIKA